MAFDSPKGGARGREIVFALWVIGVFGLYALQFKAIFGALLHQFGLT